MANRSLDQWTNDTPLGHINDEFDNLWTQVDLNATNIGSNDTDIATNAANIASNDTDIANLRVDLDNDRYPHFFGSATDARSSASLNNLWNFPVRVFADAATHHVRHGYYLPSWLATTGVDVDVNVYWLVNNAGADANVRLTFEMDYIKLGTGGGGGDVIASTTSDTAVGTGGTYDLKVSTFSTTNFNFTDVVGVSMYFEREGGHANDTYTAQIWYLWTDILFGE